MQLPRLKRLYADLHEALVPLLPAAHPVLILLVSPLSPTSAPLRSALAHLAEVLACLRTRCAPARDARVDALARRLDGLPLALELAAARVPVLGIDGLRQHLGERFRVLTGGARMALRKHQTLRAALDWSTGRGGDPVDALRVAGGLAIFWHWAGLWAEGRRWAETAVRAADAAADGRGEADDAVRPLAERIALGQINEAMDKLRIGDTARSVILFD